MLNYDSSVIYDTVAYTYDGYPTTRNGSTFRWPIYEPLRLSDAPFEEAKRSLSGPWNPYSTRL